MTAVESPTISPVLVPAKTWPAPGRGEFILIGIAGLVMLEAASRFSFMFFVIGAMTMTVIAFTWLFRLLPTLIHRRLRLSRSEWLRWLVVPVLIVAIYGACVTDVPFALRLAASRGAMDRAASALMADPDLELGWIGLYPVERIERLDGGVRFVVWGSGFLDPLGFVYMADGREPPVFGEDIYEPLDRNWWSWQDSW